MIQTQINFEELEQKTSTEFIKEINHTVEHVRTSKTFEGHRDIQFVLEKNEFTLSVIMCISGSIQTYEYRFSNGKITHNRIGWADIKNFFDIKLKTKKIEQSV